MKVLLCGDESEQARTARDLVAALPLAERTVVRVLQVLPAPTLAGLSASMRSRLVDAALTRAGDELERWARPLRKDGRQVAVETLAGRPASVILEVAGSFKPDLIVVGSRGSGAFTSAILGSVSAEVVDHAPSPVLIARARRISAVVLAEDGSTPSRRVRLFVARSGLFRGLPATVVSVAQPDRSLALAVASAFSPATRRAVQDRLRRSEAEHGKLAAKGAAQLVAAGLRAKPMARTGEPAEILLEVAAKSPTSLIAIGTRGRSGIARLVLGSVARSVLLGARGSVLVVPPSRA